ncbi:carbonic anhydrase [Chloroflexota bacterium]
MPTAALLAGIARFQHQVRDDPELLERFALQEQEPSVLFISCSDARVPPELITSAQTGDLFVARNVANIVPPYGSGDMGMGAIIEYAVLQLRVEHIVVCGHTDCGGIKAMDRPVDWRSEPHIARWIEYARPAKTKTEASGLPGDQHHLTTVRENVLLQLDHLRSYDPVREGERGGSLRLHGWVYRLETASFEEFKADGDVWMPLLQDVEDL